MTVCAILVVGSRETWPEFHEHFQRLLAEEARLRRQGWLN